MAFDLVITGNDGIGLAIGRRALEIPGTRVVFGARRPLAELPRLQALLEQYPDRAKYFPGVDVAVSLSAGRFRNEALDFFPFNPQMKRPLHVVANAGIELADNAPDIDLQDQINVDGTRNTFNAFRAAVRDRGGMLASMSSIVGVENAPLPTRHRYAATKNQAIGIAFATRELLPTETRVSAFAIAPGAIMTGMIHDAPLLGMMLVAAAGKAKTEPTLGASLAPLAGVDVASTSGAELLLYLIGTELSDPSGFSNLLGRLSGRDPGLAGKRTIGALGMKLMAEPNSALAARTREVLLATKLVIPPEDVAEAVVAQLVANKVPDGGILKVYGHPAVAGLVKGLSTLLNG